MRLTFLHLAARRGEIFRRKLDDTDFNADQVRLWTSKREGGHYEYEVIHDKNANVLIFRPREIGVQENLSQKEKAVAGAVNP